MALKALLSLILDDDALTRGLGDAEARMLVEWLVERAEAHFAEAASEADARADVIHWCGRARAIARFVALWCHRGHYGPATQLAATERFAWPLPNGPVDPCDLMGDILRWEASLEDTDHPQEKRRAA